MKRIFTLAMVITMLFLDNDAKSQVVLNELYASPNGGNHEFFELFNVSTENDPVSVDGFTMVTYYEQGSTKGFYVLDLPALNIDPRGYLVGASALPFSYQSEANSSNADFSWNDPNLAANSGYLQKWELAGSDAGDGNASYNLVAVPANLNDLFYKVTGSGFNYAVFIYSNGILVNLFYGGSNGSTPHPLKITAMPQINLTYMVGGVANPFSIAFNQLGQNVAEYVTAEVGTDNGYIRANDGVCGTWVKSSSSVNHTPSLTNGSSTASSGTLTISATITRGTGSTATNSTVTYDITSASSSVFPVELQVYTDLGSIPGQLDAQDTYISSTIQNSTADPSVTTTFSPVNANILIVAKTVAGCFGQLKYITASLNLTLPVKLLSLNGYLKDNTAQLSWKVEENETVQNFDVERSYDGLSFMKANALSGTSLPGIQDYRYAEKVSHKEKIYYRLKMVDKNSLVEYSKILALSSTGSAIETFRLMQNPVTQKISVSYIGEKTEVVQMKVVSLTGAHKMAKTFNTYSGMNQLTLNVDQHLPRGMYILLIGTGSKHQAVKFMRQ